MNQLNETIIQRFNNIQAEMTHHNSFQPCSSECKATLCCPIVMDIMGIARLFYLYSTSLIYLVHVNITSFSPLYTWLYSSSFVFVFNLLSPQIAMESYWWEILEISNFLVSGDITGLLSDLIVCNEQWKSRLWYFASFYCPVCSIKMGHYLSLLTFMIRTMVCS